MATPRLCAIPDCGKRHYSLGYCMAHYSRFTRHGDPLAGRTFQGAILKYIESDVLGFNGNECLIWPFYKTPTLYGLVVINGKRQVATRYICTRVHGNPPTPRHEAAHSCGNGHIGCVNPQHLSWKTASENQADKIFHGTDSRGERSPNAKLTDDNVREIRKLLGLHTKAEIARRFGVAPIQIANIEKRKAWGHVDAA